jgi:hypothetical protein
MLVGVVSWEDVSRIALSLPKRLAKQYLDGLPGTS